jgi:hypothetical protein
MAVSVERAESARELLNVAARLEERAADILGDARPPLIKDELLLPYVALVRLEDHAAAECGGEAILAALRVLSCDPFGAES